jgi:hypothetical protein
MDPISALGIASSVITFVDFAAKLISTTKKIFTSDEGATIENLELEDICNSLNGLIAQLEQQQQTGPAAQPSLSNSALSQSSSKGHAAIRDLAASCRKDCQDILAALQAVRVPNGQHQLWKSVKAAFKTTISSRKIAAIEARLERTQRLMSLHVGSILRLVVFEGCARKEKPTDLL